MHTLTSSSLSAFRTCPRLYFFKYVLLKAPATVAQTLAFGKAWHKVMELWWTDGLAAVAQWLLNHATEIGGQDASKLAALLAHYAPPKDQYEVLGVEMPFEVRIENPNGGRAFYGYRLAGKLDLALRKQSNGRIVVPDHKTTSSEIVGFGRYWQALQMDFQMQSYCLSIPALFDEEAEGFVYDVVRKPTIKLCGKDDAIAAAKEISPSEAYQLRCEVEMVNTPESYFQWREHPKTDMDMLEARRDLWQQAEIHRFCTKDNRFPRNSNSCVGRYGTCEFLDVCSGCADINDETRYRTKECANEELVEEEED